MLTSVSSTEGLVLWKPAARRVWMMAGRRSARWISCDCDMVDVGVLPQYHVALCLLNVVHVHVLDDVSEVAKFPSEVSAMCE